MSFHNNDNYNILYIELPQSEQEIILLETLVPLCLMLDVKLQLIIFEV